MAKQGLFNFTGLTVVGKRSTSFEGNQYYYVTLSNGYTATEFGVDADTYNVMEPFSTYSGSCDYVNKKLKLVTFAKVTK